MQNTILSGKWTYRSFNNITALTDGDPQKLAGLLFAEATFTFGVVSDTGLKGAIDWDGGGLDLKGMILPPGKDVPLTVSIKGYGRKGTTTDGWEYDYYATLAHQWPNAVNQVTALVGTVIRVNAHGPGAPAGYTASFIALKQS
jgi:hypothetical protein